MNDKSFNKTNLLKIYNLKKKTLNILYSVDEKKPRRSVCPKATNPTPASLSGQWLQSCYQQFELMGRVNCCSHWSDIIWHTGGKGKGKVHSSTGHEVPEGE